MSRNPIESNSCAISLSAKAFIKELAEKHKVKPESIMIGFINYDCKSMYVWDWSAGRSQDEQFKVLEIISFD